jgi:ribulose-phosphate 3-epimerase
LKKEIQITASLMCADQLRLAEHIKKLEEYGIDGLHIDIMDHHFAPNLALSIDTFNQIKRITNLPMEVHLMVQKPFSIITELDFSENDRMIFHIESDLGNYLKNLSKFNTNLGIAISPGTSFNLIEDEILSSFECLLILTVNPGFAGQKMVDSTFNKVRDFIENRGKNFSLEYIIDGHVDRDLINLYSRIGVYNFVGGSTGLYTSKNANYQLNIQRLKYENYREK